MTKPTRRIISGIENSVSRVIVDDQVDLFVPYEMIPSFQIANLFYTEDNPQSIHTRHLATPYDINLPKNALRVLKLRMATKKELTKNFIDANQPVPDDWSKFNLHSTDSVDYIYILSGQITCIIGDQAVDLQEGDFLTQIGAEHTWINDHDEPCYMLCIMVGSEPSGFSKKMVVG